MVVVSGAGIWSDYADYGILLAGLSAKNFGDHVVVTGLAADRQLFSKHFDEAGELLPKERWDGPTGFIVNSVNWAESGRFATLISTGRPQPSLQSENLYHRP